MRAEKVLWWLTMGCAVLLVLAPLTPRTTWLPRSRTGLSLITEGVGWQAIAALVGIAAIGALVAGVRAHRRESAVTGAAIATFGFGLITVGMTRHRIDLTNGVTSVNPGSNWELHPAPFIPLFAGLAATGAVCAFALTLLWLQPAATGADFAVGSLHSPLGARGDGNRADRAQS
jgi:hypothetical protein